MNSVSIVVTKTSTERVRVTEYELGRALQQLVLEKTRVDYEGADLVTDYQQNDALRTTYQGNRDWPISPLPSIASLVDAANVLMYGEAMHVYPEQEVQNEQDPDVSV